MGNCLPFLSRCGGGGEEDDTAPLQHRRSTSLMSTASTSHESTPVSSRAPPPYSHDQNVYNPVQREQQQQQQSGPPAVSEEQQLRLARRLGLLQDLPTDTFVEGGKGDVECAICMVDLVEGDPIRFLPCLHSYHVACVDDWLMRSFTCPSCMEPVDSALLSSYTTHNVSNLAALSSSPATAGPATQVPRSSLH